MKHPVRSDFDSTVTEKRLSVTLKPTNRIYSFLRPPRRHGRNGVLERDWCESSSLTVQSRHRRLIEAVAEAAEIPERSLIVPTDALDSRLRLPTYRQASESFRGRERGAGQGERAADSPISSHLLDRDWDRF